MFPTCLTTIHCSVLHLLLCRYAHAVVGKTLHTEQLDLQKSRQRLKEMGFVYKANFEDPSVDIGGLGDREYADYQQSRAQSRRNRVTGAFQERTKLSEDAYAAWKQAKVRVLPCINHYVFTIGAHSIDQAESDEARRSLPAIPLNACQDEMGRDRLWLRVGAALKAVDSSLLGGFSPPMCAACHELSTRGCFGHGGAGAWQEWSDPYYKRGECASRWELFPPRPIDTDITMEKAKQVLGQLLSAQNVRRTSCSWATASL